jgi:hypothetical protein
MTKQDLIGKEVFVCDDPKTLRCITFEKVLGFDEDCIDCESQVIFTSAYPQKSPLETLGTGLGKTWRTWKDE